MYRLGLDIGSSTIKAVLMRDDVIEQAEIVHHYGDLLNGLVEIFTKSNMMMSVRCPLQAQTVA